jgi:hypothetical protein
MREMIGTFAKHWADISKTADLKEELLGNMNKCADPRPPYTLVLSLAGRF